MNLLLPILMLVSSSCVLKSEGEPKALDFNRDVRPILSDKCFHCHGPDAKHRKADLRLDEQGAAFAKLKESDGFAIVPGRPEESEFWKRICSEDAEEQMPPAKSNKILSKAEKEILRRWIAGGAKYEGHWAFQPIKMPIAENGAVDAIDRIVRARLKKEALGFSPEADRVTLLRRLSLDLSGLPPSTEEIQVFVSDSSPGAYERQVDRLLSIPRYGEHMALSWMDIARYADTDGFQLDRTRVMWPWRDWVVKAYNQDMPYDQFISWQIAGDLLPGVTQEQILATGFNRNHMLNNEGGAKMEPSRVEYVIDRTITTGTAVLGLTLECCRCHDHKYDPIATKDFYGLSAYFNQVEETGVTMSWGPRIKVDSGPWGQQEVMVMKDLAAEKQRKTWVLTRGEWDQHGEEVHASVPAAISPALPSNAPRNRLTLAEWLVSTKNPLTARVEVNRQWQRFFGQGLTRTPEDFGMQGEYPSHPELLDFLAADFMRQGWSVKKLQRRIVTSATYKQRAEMSPELAVKDPQNRLLARQSRFRLASTVLRDQALAVSGLLVGDSGGPGVFPYQPDGIWEEVTNNEQHYKVGKGAELYRRSLYVFWRRLSAPASFFDISKRQACQVRNIRTNTPLQALALLNDPAFVECGRALAQKSLSQGIGVRQRLAWAFRQATCRRPTDTELDVLLAGYTRLLAGYKADPAAATRLLSVGSSPATATVSAVELAALACSCSVILNLDETLNRE